MPNTTGDYPMPYPNSSAVPDVPGDILALAQEVDDTLTAEFGALLTPGLVTVIPSSVSGTGVTVDSTTGIVSFSGSTAITVEGAFGSTFRNYEIKYDSSGTAAGATLQLRVSGTTSVTNYDLTENLARNSVTSSSTVLNQASWAITGASNTRHAGSVTLFAPNVAIETVLMSQTGSHANPAVASTTNGLKVSFGTHRPLTAYTAFVLTFSAAQTGVLRVTGYN